MKDRIKILIIDDDAFVLRSCEKILTEEGYNVDTVNNGRKGLQRLNEDSFDFVLLDITLPGLGGMEALKKIKERFPDMIIIVITNYSSIEYAVECIKLGATDYIPKPFSPIELTHVMKKALEKKSLIGENLFLKRKFCEDNRYGDIIGTSYEMKKIFELIKKVAKTDSTVLITGESGTGKELIARTIHSQSHRAKKPFVPIDCTALTETLLESELFGHVKGSFTGAILTKPGLLELANGGTLFLDEIGNLDLYIQGKLLRVIQEREFTPVGGTTRKKIDVRIITATNRNLEKMIKEGKFRKDLFYRLNIVPITIPPIRERKSDIPLIVYHLIDKFNEKVGKKIKYISPDAMKLFTEYEWPGNVRELENIIERLMVTNDGNAIYSENLSSNIYQNSETVMEIPKTNDELKHTKKVAKEELYREIERNFLLESLKRNDWNITKTAKDVRMQRSNFQAMMKKNEISIKQYR